MNREESLAFVDENIKIMNYHTRRMKFMFIAVPITAAGSYGLGKFVFEINNDERWALVCVALAGFMLIPAGISTAFYHREKEFLKNLKKELADNEQASIIPDKEYFYTYFYRSVNDGTPVEYNSIANKEVLDSYTKCKRRCHNGREAIKNLNIIDYNG